jgi:hypothetical protein
MMTHRCSDLQSSASNLEIMLVILISLCETMLTSTETCSQTSVCAHIIRFFAQRPEIVRYHAAKVASRSKGISIILIM